MRRFLEILFLLWLLVVPTWLLVENYRAMKWPWLIVLVLTVVLDLYMILKELYRWLKHRAP